MLIVLAFDAVYVGRGGIPRPHCNKPSSTLLAEGISSPMAVGRAPILRPHDLELLSCLHSTDTGQNLLKHP